MAYVDELRELLANAEERLSSCDNDAAYASILRQVRGLKADIHELSDDDGYDAIDELCGGLNAVR